MSGLGLRVVTALLALPVLLVILVWAPLAAFAALMAAVTVLGALEWGRMHGRSAAGIWPVLVLAAGLPAAVHVAGEPVLGPAVSVGAALLGLGALGMKDDPRERLARLLEECGAFLLIVLPLAHFVLLRSLEGGRGLIFFLLLVIWAVDTAAYFVGTAFGRRRMAPVLSPRKSLEGLLGGVLAGALVAAIAAPWLTTFSRPAAAVLAVALGLLGQASDLLESLWKRARGVKDSGTLMPGHGGLLDRVDAFLLTAPLLYWLVRLLGRA